MARRIQSLPRPEAGAEFGVTWTVRHNCPLGIALRKELDDENIDEIIFPVGTHGYEMPLNVPFDVMAAHECQACHVWPAMVFVWTGPRLWVA